MTLTIESVTSANTACSEIDQQGSWLCLRFHCLPLNAHGVSLSSVRPTAISYQQQILLLNTQAHSEGVQVTQSMGHALMLCPNLWVIERDQARETQKLADLSLWAYRFSSHVCIYNSEALLVEIGRSLMLFKGLNNLQTLMQQDLQQFVMDACSGVAYTPKAAYLASFNPPAIWQLKPNEEQVGEVSIECCDIEPKVIKQLQHCGFQTMRDLLPIPHAELGQRFGYDLVKYLNQVFGQLADPQKLIKPPQTFAARIDFEEPISNRTWIDEQVQGLLQKLIVFIVDQHLVCHAFEWRFYHRHNRLLESFTVRLNSQRANFSIFYKLTELKFARAELAGEFLSIELISKNITPKQLFNNDLFEQQCDTEAFGRLLEKLSGRLGHTALSKIHVQDEYLPELANQRVVWSPSIRHIKEITKLQAAYANSSADGSCVNKIHDQPVWLLESPRTLTRGNQPIRDDLFVIVHGPERITSHWWSQPECRDYYIAREPDGRFIWVFYDRHKQTWYLHGLFA